MKRMSIVIAMYRSECTIRKVVDEITHNLKQMKWSNYEIVLVNDCSPDGTRSIAYEMAKEDSKIIVIDLAKNAGQPNAMMAGFHYATGDYILCMDDDLQHPASAIHTLMETLLEKDMDVVFAKYEIQKQSAFRRLGSRVNKWMAEKMTGKPKDITSNSFFVMRRFVCDALLAYTHSNPYIYGIIYSTTTHISNVTVEHRERAVGKSNYSIKKLLSFWLNGFLNFSIKPLRIATTIGTTISLISLFSALVLFIDRLMHPTSGVLGWTSLVVAIIFFSGIQLIFIGVLGEYLGRLYISESKLPLYSVRDTVNLNKNRVIDIEKKQGGQQS